MTHPSLSRSRSWLPLSVLLPSRLPALGCAMGVGPYDPDDDPELRDILHWALGDPPGPWSSFSWRSEFPGRHPASNSGGSGRDRASRDGLHCLTCGRALTPAAKGGDSVVCAEHGRLMAAVLPFPPFRHYETVWIVAAASHRSFLVARLGDRRRHRASLRHLRLICMDNWQWNLT
jgi:hypothetical protein